MAINKPSLSFIEKLLEEEIDYYSIANTPNVNKSDNSLRDLDNIQYINCLSLFFLFLVLFSMRVNFCMILGNEHIDIAIVPIIIMHSNAKHIL